MDDSTIKISPQERAHPNLRKLARALLSMAARQLDEHHPDVAEGDAGAVKRGDGEAA